MAVSNSEAIRLFQKFFRGPVLKAGSRRYIFDTYNITNDNISDIHLEFYKEGSNITRQEILTFIDQKVSEEPILFLHLSLSYIIPGELFSVIEENQDGHLTKYLGIKCSSTHYLIAAEKITGEFESNIISLPTDFILSEQGKSPFQKDAVVLEVKILPPPSFFRLIDSTLLDERYAESNPENILPLYSKLMESHLSGKVYTNWTEILDMASSSGVSSYTIFSILNILARHD